LARVKRGVTTHARHKKVLELAKGYRGRGSTAYRVAIEKVEKALQYAYRDRRNRKRDFRALWIQRINAGARQHGLTYSQFMHGIKLAGLDLDRKVLSDIAIREPEAFQAIAATAQAALERRLSPPPLPEALLRRPRGRQETGPEEKNDADRRFPNPHLGRRQDVAAASANPDLFHG